MGIPTGAIPDDITSLGYILSINTINSWINNSLVAYSPPNTNNYSRVASILENMTVNQIDQLQPYVPGTEPTDSSQENKNKIQPEQSQKESIVIESMDVNQKTNPEQNNSISSEKGNNSSIKDSEQRRSIVANAVQEMIKVAERNGGVGQEIKTIAQTQTQNQEKLETGIQKIQSRSGFAKFFIGPNYGEIKNSQKLLEQNKERIQNLNQLKTQVADQGDQLQLVEQIQLLEQVNQQIETSLTEAQKGFSLFGWIFRLFTK